jgi:hypothetical protein
VDVSLLRFFANEYREFAYCPTGKGGGIDNSCSPTGEVGTKAPWQMNQAEFNALADKGRIVPATGKWNDAEKAYNKRPQSKQTGLGSGEAAGYSQQDIAAYYVELARRNGAVPGMDKVIGRKWLVQDAIKEGKIKSHPDFPMFDSHGKVRK